MASGHLVADRKLALHGDVNLHQLDHARWQLVALLQLLDLLFYDLAQHVDLARGHLFDLVDLLVDARVLVGVLDAFQVAGGDALDGLAIEDGPLADEFLVGLLVVQVRLHFLVAKDIFQTLQALVGQNADLVSQVLFQPLDLQTFDMLGALVLFLSLAREDLHVHHGAFDTRRRGK